MSARAAALALAACALAASAAAAPRSATLFAGEIETSAPQLNVARAASDPAPGPSDGIESSAPAPDADAADPGAAESAAPPESTGAPDADDELAGIDDSFLNEDLGPDPAERDHTPRWNRSVFAFNEAFIEWLMRPISRGYQAVLPQFVRDMLVRGFANLESPVIFANDLLQLDPCRAGRTLGRFALNSVVGLAGTIDVAAEMGVPRHDTDFGETLGRWGVRSGPFLMLPLLGPSTARDTLGELVDTALRPEIWLLGGIPRLAVTGGDGLSTYDINAVRLDALRNTSIDFYAALRSAYLMDRDAHIEELRAAGRCGFGKRAAE